MSAPDNEFIKQLRATFQIEAQEHLQAIAGGLLAMEKSPSLPNLETIEGIYREAHSLKGAARAVDLTDIERICQTIESVFSAWKHQLVIPSADTLDVLHKSLDVIHGLASGTGSNDIDNAEACERLLGQLASLVPAERRSDRKPSEQKSPEIKTANAVTLVPPDGERESLESVRVSTAKLDTQLLRAEDLLPLKSLMVQRASEIQDLTRALELWKLRWTKILPNVRAACQPGGSRKSESSLMQAASPELAEFFEWNTDFHRLLVGKVGTMAAQARSDSHIFGKQVDVLLEDSKKLLMLPFSTLAGIFPKLVRDLCRELGKEADLIIKGTEVEIDKSVLEEMKDALIHILRNCVDHGIESCDARVQANKPRRGTLTIAVAQVNGSKVEILVSDDGGGVDLAAVKEAAVRRGRLSPNDALAMSPARTLALVFEPDVSTSQIVTTISGRGLGMTIAQSKVEKLGGTMVLASTAHVGTSIRIVLPQTLATFRGVLVMAAEQMFVIPAANIDQVLRIRAADIKTVENRESISVAGRVLSLAWLAAVLSLPMNGHSREASAFISVVVLCADGEHMAFAVDRVLHEEEVLVKSLRKPLLRVRNIGGATVLGSGKAVPTLNVNDVIKSARLHGAPVVLNTKTPSSAKAAKRVLLVEDSITSRMLLKGILESAGYQVGVAVDGMEGFARLRESSFDLVVSDVEMPRLNGFDLAARIRADKRLADLPIVLVTALESREQRERGVDVGANAYLAKSNFDQNKLLEVIRRLA